MSDRIASPGSRRLLWMVPVAVAPIAAWVTVLNVRSAGAAQAGGAAPAASSPEKKPAATFEVYADRGGEYRWRLRAQNSQILATSSEGYKEKRSCLSSIESVKAVSPLAPIVEQPTAP